MQKKLQNAESSGPTRQRKGLKLGYVQRSWRTQGPGGIIQAARDGLAGAARHFVKHDPASMQKKARFGREAWDDRLQASCVAA